MVDANLTNYDPTHIGHFSFFVFFAENVTGFTAANITYTAGDGNGITGLMFSAVMGSGATYSVNVSVPANSVGTFTVALTGQVMVSGVAQDIAATPQVYSYDTATTITVTLDYDNLRYNNDGTIALPLTFAEDVFWFDKSDVTIKHVTGDDPALLQYYVRGEAAAYEIVLIPASGSGGAVLVSLGGAVRKTSDNVREIVRTEEVFISYNNRVTAVAEIGTPFKTDDGYWNVLMTFESAVVGLGVDGIESGIDGTVPVLYRALTLDVLPAAVPAYTGAYADYAGQNAEHCIGNWYFEGDSNTRVQGKYFWYKILPDTDEDRMPEIEIIENPNVYVDLKPASVEG